MYAHIASLESSGCAARRWRPSASFLRRAGSARPASPIRTCSRAQEPVALADLLRRLQRAASQPAQADHARERAPSRGAVDVPDRDDRPAAGASRRRRWSLDGVLYVTGPNNYAWALDARTGRPFWRYRRELPTDLTYGASAPVNRGFGMLGDGCSWSRSTRTSLALDMQDRHRRLGRRCSADYKIGYSATVAPLVVKDKVIVGISGRRLPDARISRRLRSADRRAHLALLHRARRRASRAARRGRRRPTCWRAAAAAPGSPAATIPS